MSATELTAVIDRYEEDKAVLLLRVKEEEIPVIWPRKCLPENRKINEGAVLKISIEFCEDATFEAQSEAEQLLQELSLIHI